MKAKEKSLFIDTASSEAKVCLGDSCLTWPAQGKADLALAKINHLLKRHNLTIDDVTAVCVNPGPGSFTGSRVAAALANGLNWAAGRNRQVKPVYSSPAQITKPKQMPAILE